MLISINLFLIYGHLQIKLWVSFYTNMKNIVKMRWVAFFLSSIQTTDAKFDFISNGEIEILFQYAEL